MCERTMVKSLLIIFELIGNVRPILLPPWQISGNNAPTIPAPTKMTGFSFEICAKARLAVMPPTMCVFPSIRQ